jgi:hypothetical protein
MKGEGHNALSHSCPLRALYRAAIPDPIPISKGEAQPPVAQSSSDAETLPPTPGAAGPFTVVSENRSATLVALHKQGASMEELCRALLTTEEIADLSSHSS